MLFNFWKRKTNGDVQQPNLIRDVFFDPAKKFIDLQKHYFVIKINKDFFKKFRYNHKHLIAGFLVLLVPISFIIYSNYSFASIANFYPTKCLGGWENPENAEESPNLSTKSDLNEFNNLNSSRMRAGSPIYCGGFKGEIPENSKPIGFKVSFSMSIDDGSVIHEETKTIESVIENSDVINTVEENIQVDPMRTDDSLDESTSNGTTQIPEEVIEIIPEVVPEPAPEPIPEPVVETQSEITAFLSKILFKKVLAQETPIETVNVPEPIPEAIPEPEPKPAPEPVVEPAQIPEPEPILELETEKVAEDEAISNETDVEIKEETTEGVTTIEEIITPVVPTVETPSDAFLEVKYTLDGENWEVLGQISRNDWQDTSFDIPLEAWININDLQISVDTISTFDVLPTVYLDSMIVSIEYEEINSNLELPTILLKDSSIVLNGDDGFSLALDPNFAVIDPKLTGIEINELVKDGKAEIISDPDGLLGKIIEVEKTEEEKKIEEEKKLADGENQISVIVENVKEEIKDIAGGIIDNLIDSKEIKTDPVQTDDIIDEPTSNETETVLTESGATDPNTSPGVEFIDSLKESVTSIVENLKKVPEDKEKTKYSEEEIKLKNIEIIEVFDDPIRTNDSPDESTSNGTDPVRTDNEKVESEKENTKPIDIVSFLLPKTVSAATTKMPEITAIILDSNGNGTDLIANVNQTVSDDGKQIQKIDIKKPKYQFSPGKYTLRVSVKTENAIFVSEQDFSWGVLAVNTNKSIYSMGDKAYIQMGVLDDAGHTVCNSDLDMEIKSPSGVVSKFSTGGTETGTITRDKLCGKDNVIDVPDYYAYYDVPNEEGVYEMTLTANNKNGIKTVHDSFVVKNDVPFVVERKSATRIYPGATYPVEIKITAKEDWSGTVQDFVPASFEITPTTPLSPPQAGGEITQYDSVKINESVFGISDSDGGQSISWNLDLKKGETKIIGYTYKAPFISPEFYLLGPLTFNNLLGEEFKESRRWQIASDATTYYWVGGTGNWNDPTNHWSTSSGGAGGAGNTPTAADTCIFDDASSTADAAYTVTVNASATCLDLTMGGPGSGNNVTWAGSSALAISGSLNLSGGSADITRTYTGAITFNATATGKTIDFNGVTMASATTFNGTGGGWTLTTNGWNNGASNITLTAGSFNDGGLAITTTGEFSISGSTTRTITLSGATSVGTWTATTITNLTRTFTGNVLTMTGASSTFAGGAITTYNEVVITGAGGSASLTGANTFATLRAINTSSTATRVLVVGAAQTVSTLLEVTGANNSAGRMVFGASSLASIRTITVNGSFSLSNVDFKGVTAAGTAGAWSGSSIGNRGRLSNITVSTARDVYWVHGASATYQWTDTQWFTTSGGSTASDMPLPQDMAIFDANSFTAGSKTVQINNTNLDIGGMNWTGVANSPTLTMSTVAKIHGSVTFSSSMTFSSSVTITLAPHDALTKTFTSNGLTMPSVGLEVDGQQSSGIFQLGSDLAIPLNTTMTQGTLDLNDYNYSTTAVTSNNSTWNLSMGSGILSLTGTGTIWSFAFGTPTQETSTIKITNSSSSSKTFVGGSRTYYKLEVATGSTGATIITGSNTFNGIYVNGSSRVLHFTAGTTTTLAAAGTGITTSGTGITITSATAATHTLSKSSGTVNISNTTLSYSTAQGGATWLASTTNTNVDSGNNSGWDFSALADVTISGTTNGNNGATVRVAVNGTTQAETGTISGTDWSIASVTAPSSGDIITVWIDGEASESDESTAVTKYGAGDVTGMVLNEGILTIGSSENTSVSTTDMALCDYDTGCADEDVMHSSTGGALTVDASSAYTGETLSILASNTLTVASGSSETVTTEKINNAGTITSNSSPTYTLTGTSGTLFTNSGTFTQATSEVIVTSASGTPSLLSAGTTFHKLTINSAATVINAGAVITMSSANASNKLYIQAGVLNDGGSTIVGTSNGTLEVANSATLCISGTATGTSATCNSGAVPTTASTFPTNYTNGNITLGTTSTVIYLADAAQTISSTPTYGNLKLTPLFVTTSRTYTAGGALTINGDFTILPDESGAGTPVLTINAAGAITVAAGKTTTISKANSATSVLDMRPSSTDYDLSTGYLNVATGGTLDLTSVVSATALTLTATSGTLFTLAGTFTITSGTPTVVTSGNGDATLNSGAITFYNLTSSGTGIKTLGASITINNNMTISAGTFDPTTSYLATGSGTNTLSVTGTVRSQHSTFAGDYASFETVTFNTNSTADYILNGTQTVSNTISPYYNLTVSTGGTKTLGGDTTVSNVMTIGSGATLSASTYTLTLSGTTGTPFVKTGTFTPGTGTVSYTGANAGGNTTVVAGTYNNLTINGSDTYDIGSAGSAFLYRSTITIDKTKVANTNQTDFPVLISGVYDGTGGEPDLRVTGSGGDVTDTDGDDIGFYSDASLTTKLKWEKEIYVSTTGEIVYWVKIPTLSTSVNTVIYMAYGNSSITTDQSDPTNVWDSNYAGVWHMPDGSSLSGADSTTNNNDGTVTASPTATTGKMDGGGNFIGSGSSLVVTDHASNSPSTDITFSTWVKASNISQNASLISKWGSTNNSTFALYLGQDGGSNKIGAIIRQSNESTATAYPTDTLSNDTWYYMVGTANSTDDTLRIYINGALNATTGSYDGTLYNASGDLTIGKLRSDTVYSFTGLLDEARLSNVARSTDWITTEYNNQSSPSTFYTMGAEASANVGLAITGNLTITAGTLDTVSGQNYPIVVGGNWSNSGTFTARSGTVTLNSATTAEVGGSSTTSFYNLTITHTAAKEVDFAVRSGNPLTITNTFTVAGSVGNLIKLYSTVGATKWYIKPTGTASVSYADVKDGGCDASAITMAPTDTTNSGNNDSCWGLTVAPTISFSLSSNSIALGTLSTSVARFSSHTISAASNATSGFSISYKGLSLTSGANSIPVYTAGASSPGTAGFGINLVDNGNPDVGATVTTNSGTCGINTNYDDINAYSFVSDTTTTITAITAAADCIFTASYVGNISNVTPAGAYETTITYLVTGTF